MTSLLVDHSHVRGHATGIERYAIDQFSEAALPDHEVIEVKASSIIDMIRVQQIGLPLRVWRDKPALALFPGFPPSPLAMAVLGKRAIVFVHDLFALERWSELNMKAKFYTSPQFWLAIKTARSFLVNSSYTRDRLRSVCRADADIGLYRAVIDDRFGLSGRERPAAWTPGRELRLVTVGTVEPRKNNPGAIAIVRALNSSGIKARLDVIGRVGWGDHSYIEAARDIATFHGFLPEEEGRRLISSADFYLCASHDEGLGLPLLEVQHGRLPVIAPDRAPFTETMRAGALLVDVSKPQDAAAEVAVTLQTPGRLTQLSGEAAINVARWNADALSDRSEFRMLMDRAGVSRRNA
jgi:glycosyltransferase involved in cell wall biosynthesis